MSVRSHVCDLLEDAIHTWAIFIMQKQVREVGSAAHRQLREMETRPAATHEGDARSIAVQVRPLLSRHD
jgi:hypothetical protein